MAKGQSSFYLYVEEDNEIEQQAPLHVVLLHHSHSSGPSCFRR